MSYNEPMPDSIFSGSVPQVYETHLVPLIFEPYAADIAARLVPLAPKDLLEVAAGTGAVTRALARMLPESCAITATDFSEGMLEQAKAAGTSRPVEWQIADAMELPFPDNSFDAIACQFGVMFFPEKPVAYAQARRVLREGGSFVFNVWDAVQHNEFTDVAGIALQELFPENPPTFLKRVPFAYYDTGTIAQHLAEGGFTKTPQFFTVTARSRAATPQQAAIALCQGTPIRGEIEAQNSTSIDDATVYVAQAIAKQFGPGPIEGKIQAIVVAVEK